MAPPALNCSKSKSIIMSVIILLTLFIAPLTDADRIIIDDNSYKLEFARTTQQKQKGLSGRQNLEANEGMLFVFNKPGFYVFWMKDMSFPIDILWIDKNMQIVDIERDVSPDDYPQRYVSQKMAQYVLEINAGQAYQKGIRIGDQVTISGL